MIPFIENKPVKIDCTRKEHGKKETVKLKQYKSRILFVSIAYFIIAYVSA